MNTAKRNSSITGDSSAAINSNGSTFLDCKLPKLLMRLEEYYEEDKESKNIISIVQDDENDDCSIESCDLDHKTLAFFLSSGIERFSSNEGYQDHKDDQSEDGAYIKKGRAASIDEGENHCLGSLIDTDGLSNCGSISCGSSSRRSFAFPILRSEWPGSPVRMVDAGRRYRQRRRACFLCF